MKPLPVPKLDSNGYSHSQSQPPSMSPSTSSPIVPSLSIPNCPSSIRLPRRVRIVEVGPRDGLQNESKPIDTAVKLAMVHDLVAAGITSIEVTAFVSPKWVPQLADASRLMNQLQKKPGVVYSVLVPNMKGFHAAMETAVDHIAVFAAATETFSKRNVNCSIQESLDRFEQVITNAKRRGVRVRGYVSCVVGCPYEGYVEPSKVADVAFKLYQMGCYQISLGDTIGVGNPKSIAEMVSAVVARGVPVEALAIHCHDTRGMALANVLAAMSLGVAVIDSSVAGLGGCPFAPGAAGNLATEDLVYMLQGMAIDCGDINLDKLVNIGTRICKYLGRQTSSRVAVSKRCEGVLPHSLRRAAT